MRPSCPSQVRPVLGTAEIERGQRAKRHEFSIMAVAYVISACHSRCPRSTASHTRNVARSHPLLTVSKRIAIRDVAFRCVLPRLDRLFRSNESGWHRQWLHRQLRSAIIYGVRLPTSRGDVAGAACGLGNPRQGAAVPTQHFVVVGTCRKVGGNYGAPVVIETAIHGQELVINRRSGQPRGAEQRHAGFKERLYTSARV